MPASSFPEELVLIVFEHLYHLLCVNTAKEHLDDPIAHDLVFSRLALVSKAWHRLATPFLHRHFSTDVLTTYPNHAHRVLLSGSVRSIIHCDAPVNLETWNWILQLNSGNLELLSTTFPPMYDRKPDPLAYSLFTQPLPSLRRIRLLLWCSVNASFFKTLSAHAPLIDHVEIKAEGALYYHATSELWAFRSLRTLRLDFRGSSTRIAAVTDCIVPTFLLSCAEMLVHVKIALPTKKHRTPLSFRDLFPRPFPKVEVLRCSGSTLDCSAADFFLHFPAVEDVEIPVRNVPSFDHLPPSLHSLHLTEARHGDFSIYAVTITTALETGVFAQLRAFGVDLHQGHSACNVCAAPKRALVEAFSRSPILFHANWLAEHLPDDMIFSLPQLAAYSAPVKRLPDDSDKEVVDVTDAGTLETGTANFGEDEAKTAGQGNGELSGPSELTEELDWDAEDWDMFAGFWTDEKRAERGLGAAGDEGQVEQSAA
ncbi:hypothetical protein JCM10207_009282 [Rhodosporidiobolus poonsookiae]